MCDWEAEEYAEYLLWVEAERARARARPRPAPEESRVKASFLTAIPREAAEA
ncbi:MAG TPA: hypothetical protein VEG66_09350 [Thermoplasmata archaeon]|nr:hypothetical protein [Thermoplasmata archaeon]